MHKMYAKLANLLYRFFWINMYFLSQVSYLISTACFTIFFKENLQKMPFLNLYKIQFISLTHLLNEYVRKNGWENLPQL